MSYWQGGLPCILVWEGWRLHCIALHAIPMGTNCAPLVADLFLFCYERDFMMSLSDDNLTLSTWCFFCGSFLLFMFRVCHAVFSVHCSLVVTCWERASLLALLYVMFLMFCHFPVWFPGSGVVLDCIYSWYLPFSYSVDVHYLPYWTTLFVL